MPGTILCAGDIVRSKIYKTLNNRRIYILVEINK